jgi:hypothetical protein
MPCALSLAYARGREHEPLIKTVAQEVLEGLAEGLTTSLLPQRLANAVFPGAASAAVALSVRSCLG